MEKLYASARARMKTKFKSKISGSKLLYTVIELRFFMKKKKKMKMKMKNL